MIKKNSPLPTGAGLWIKFLHISTIALKKDKLKERLSPKWICQMFRPLILISLLVFFSHSASAAEKSTHWPKLDSDARGALCNKAFAIAQTIFTSDAFYLYAPPSIPESLGTKIVVGPDAVDISGGNALTVDEAVFQRIPKHNEGAPRDINWQIKGNQQFRWVMDAGSVGWRGDSYALFPVKSDITPDQFLAAISKRYKDSGFTPIVDGAWRPPLLLQENGGGEVWAIDVGQPYVFLSQWNIYALGVTGAEQQCSVKFRPDVKAAVDLLPAPIRELARLLEKTQATHEDGTLQPTARIRTRVSHTWANAAIRPWVRGGAYNSREEVDAGLERWSHDSPFTHKLYKKIYRQYPIAEQALKKYYQAKFKKSANEAASLASLTLDMAFRTYFMFPQR